MEVLKALASSAWKEGAIKKIYWAFQLGIKSMKFKINTLKFSYKKYSRRNEDFFISYFFHKFWKVI